jgi:hypothetical protein
MKKVEAHSFCIGRPWHPDGQPNNSICTYTYGVSVFHGTMAQAQATRSRIEELSGKKYFIYQLVKVQE